MSLRTVLLAVMATLVCIPALSSKAKNIRTKNRQTNRPTIVVPDYRSDRPHTLKSAHARTQAASALDTFTLAFFPFDTLNGGFPDTQGWMSIDGTAQMDTFFHVDDFVGMPTPFGPLEGTKSMWCGQRATSAPEFCFWPQLPGYGNSWHQKFVSRVFNVTGNVKFSYIVQFDNEPGYDPATLSYKDKNGNWVQAREFNCGWGCDSVEVGSINIPGSELNGQVQIRWQFTSDGAWSDEDGLFPNNGAVWVDSLLLEDSLGVVDYQDFEAEAVGAHVTSDGDWQASIPEPHGDFSSLFPGFDVTQQSKCQLNLSWFWGFFEGSPDNYACGGFPEQAVVPYKRVTAEGWTLYMDNEIWSPIIELNTDKDGNPVPADASTIVLELDWYADLPINPGVFWIPYVRGAVAGCPISRWRTPNQVITNESKSWLHYELDVTTFVDSGSEQVQIALRVADFCQFWCGVSVTGDCHTNGPLFDNVRLSRVSTNGPTWAVEPRHLYQDNFPRDLTKTGNVRLDMASDIRASSDPVIQPGDSMVVTVMESTYGLDFHTSGVPSSGPAVYLHVKDVSPAKSGVAIQGPPRWPVVGTGGGWTVVRFDQVSDSWGVVEDQFCVDVLDIIYTPGDTVYYYFSARDANGRTTYYSQHIGVTDDQAQVESLPMEVTCLPANGQTSTDILYVDGHDGSGAQPYFDSAFQALGITPDRYDVLQAPLNIGNGPASRVSSVLNQLSACYRKIIWNTGNLTFGTVGDGIFPEKSDDFGLLYSFLDNSPNGAGVYLSGDNIAAEWVGLTGGSAIALRSNYMSFNLVSDDHVSYGVPVSPLGIGASGSCFHGDTLVAYAGCPSSLFDVLEPTGNAALEMTYSGNSAHGAIVSQVTPNAVGDTARVMLSGFSYHQVHNDRVQTPADRIDHLYDIIQWLDNELPTPTGIADRVVYANELRQNYPNPFNPSTTIRYGIKTSGLVSIKVYNVAGQLVRTLVDEFQGPKDGGHVAIWKGTNDNGAQVSSGVYYYRLTAPGFTDTKKMVLLK